MPVARAAQVKNDGPHSPWVPFAPRGGVLADDDGADNGEEAGEEEFKESCASVLPTGHAAVSFIGLESTCFVRTSRSTQHNSSKRDPFPTAIREKTRFAF